MADYCKNIIVSGMEPMTFLQRGANLHQRFFEKEISSVLAKTRFLKLSEPGAAISGLPAIPVVTITTRVAEARGRIVSKSAAISVPPILRLASRRTSSAGSGVAADGASTRRPETLPASAAAAAPRPSPKKFSGWPNSFERWRPREGKEANQFFHLQ